MDSVERDDDLVPTPQSIVGVMAVPTPQSIIGVMALRGASAPFARADLVVTMPDGHIFILRRTGNPSPLTPDDHQLLLHTGEITPIPPHPWYQGTRAWALRPSFTEREDFLEDAGDAVDKVFHFPDAWIALVDDEPRCVKDWYQYAWEDAYKLLCSRQFESALSEARLSFCLASDLKAPNIALLMLAYKRLGKHHRVTALLAMARNSRGPEFADRTARIFESLDDSDHDDQCRELFDSLTRSMWFAKRGSPEVSWERYERDARRLGLFDIADWVRQFGDWPVHWAPATMITITVNHRCSEDVYYIGRRIT